MKYTMVTFLFFVSVFNIAIADDSGADGGAHSGAPVPASEIMKKISSDDPIAEQCRFREEQKKMNPALATPIPLDSTCIDLKLLSQSTTEGTLKTIKNPKETLKESMDKRISCILRASYTVDYDNCVKAINYYNFVLNADQALNLTQQVRTDMKNKNIQEKANQQIAQGDSQTGMYDAAIASNNHQKAMQQEKALAYATAVGALIKAYTSIPGEGYAQKICAANKTCPQTVKENGRMVLANQDAKAGLATAIAEFTAKGIAAGIAMGQYGNAAQQIAKAKGATATEETDLMMERCQFNPADPACSPEGSRTPGSTFSNGDFSLGGDGLNNSFGTDPLAETGSDLGTTPDDSNQVSGINSPFEDDVKKAKGILDPAAAAQAKGGAGGSPGAGGGAGGGMGGGSASLGKDLQGADKDGEKEAQIKAGKVSGSYAAAGGGGYKGVGRGKDENPFSSLFDQKTSGGVDEDRSIASGDIDGAGSGLFQKISKRYGQVHADKRIEANNLE